MNLQYDEGQRETYQLPFDIPDSSRVISDYVVEYELLSGQVKYKSSFSVYIHEVNGKKKYFVKEPYISPELRKEISSYVNDVESWLEPSGMIEFDPVGHILNSIIHKKRLSGYAKNEMDAIKYYLLRDVVGYWLIDPLLRDPLIEDISCDGLYRPVMVWHSKYSNEGWLETNIVFENNEVLDSIVFRLVHRAGKSISSYSPIVDTSLPEGYRLVATYGKEVSSFGSSFTIRKFRERPYTISELVELGTITKEVAAYLWTVLDMKGFVIVCGPPASGKTTLINSLVSLLNPSWKIVTVEDTRELYLPHSGWKALHTKSMPEEAAVGLFELVRLSLRERPDFVVLGEARGEEAAYLFQAALTGSGCITSFHAPDMSSLRARLTQRPINLNDSLLNLIDCVVFLARNGMSRYVREVVEVGENDSVIYSSENFDINKAEKLYRKAHSLGMSYKTLEFEYSRRLSFLSAMSEGRASKDSILDMLKKFYSLP